MKLGLQVIDNKLYFFHLTHSHKIGQIYKKYSNKVNIKNFLELRNKIKNERNFKEQLGFKNLSAI